MLGHGGCTRLITPSPVVHVAMMWQAPHHMPHSRPKSFLAAGCAHILERAGYCAHLLERAGYLPRLVEGGLTCPVRAITAGLSHPVGALATVIVNNLRELLQPAQSAPAAWCRAGACSYNATVQVRLSMWANVLRAGGGHTLCVLKPRMGIERNAPRKQFSVGGGLTTTPGSWGRTEHALENL